MLPPGLRPSAASSSTFLSVLLLLLFAALLSAAKHDQTTCPAITPLSALPTTPLDGKRHQLEYIHLLNRLDRNKGKWDKTHPRWELLEALHAYSTYSQTAGEEIHRFENLYKHVPAKHKKLLESTISYSATFPLAHSLIAINAVVCQKILSHGLEYYNISRTELHAFAREQDFSKDRKKSAAHRAQVSQALKHIVRDWSSDGSEEREAAFPFILNFLSTEFPPKNSETVKILVPGAGLGRLAHEIAGLGEHIRVTSNEFSSYMNLAYRYLSSLDGNGGSGGSGGGGSSSSVRSGSKITIHPFVDSTWSHARSRSDLFRPVQIDHLPSTLLPGFPSDTLQRKVLSVEGDFTKSFHHHHHHHYHHHHQNPESFDAVTTLFFIDTARNLVEYLEKIYLALRPGGVWVNVGPVLWGTAPWVQLSVEEIVRVAEGVGFVFDGKWEEGEVGYFFGMRGLYRHGYTGVFWVARRPLKEAPREEEGGRWW